MTEMLMTCCLDDFLGALDFFNIDTIKLAMLISRICGTKPSIFPLKFSKSVMRRVVTEFLSVSSSPLLAMKYIFSTILKIRLTRLFPKMSLVTRKASPPFWMKFLSEPSIFLMNSDPHAFLASSKRVYYSSLRPWIALTYVYSGRPMMM